ncbi:efflux RND transporter periplasmic adaptor subunit [Niallia sp. Krafla_26]|uniref:efflux RND transporter periplasmic adaptor subunit n=1 Tax=Niallia sp. Krafla_26 TaxID=3064703 RepID=UPI003D164AEA
MKFKLQFVIVAVVLLVGVNLFLILKEDSKVAKSLYVGQWVSAKEQDLQESLVTDGVSAPLEEQYIYYDENKGSFEGFVVKEGDEVEVGSELFYYSTDSYTDAMAVLQSERDSIEKQLEGLKTKQTNLGSLLASSSAMLPPLDEGENTNDRFIEMDLVETETEISRLEGELEKYDEQLSSIDEKLPYLHEISDMDGTVKKMNEDLSNPIITIASNEPMIKGMVTEADQGKLQPGLDVLVSLKNGNKAYEGKVQQVSTFPEEEPSVKKESQYSFSVLLTEPIEGLTHGTHVDVKIITEEVLDAVTVPSPSLQRSQLYVLHDGKIKKRNVETGLQINQTQEISTGLQAGEVVVRKPVSFEGKSVPFYTPLHMNQWEKGMYSDLRKKEMLRLVGKGFFAGHEY